jgi:hypothetical protein
MSNTQLLPPFIPVSVVIVTSRLQFTTTEGCPDIFDQIVYIPQSEGRIKNISFLKG